MWSTCTVCTPIRCRQRPPHLTVLARFCTLYPNVYGVQGTGGWRRGKWIKNNLQWRSQSADWMCTHEKHSFHNDLYTRLYRLMKNMVGMLTYKANFWTYDFHFSKRCSITLPRFSNSLSITYAFYGDRQLVSLSGLCRIQHTEKGNPAKVHLEQLSGTTQQVHEHKQQTRIDWIRFNAGFQNDSPCTVNIRLVTEDSIAYTLVLSQPRATYSA